MSQETLNKIQKGIPYVIYASVLPFLYLFLVETSLLPTRPIWDNPVPGVSDNVPHVVHLYPRPANPQLELVISYYDEPPAGVAEIIQKAYGELPHWSKHATVYHKGVEGKEKKHGKDEDVALEAFLRDPGLKGLVGTAIGLKNEGRDGGTYLHHM